MSGSTTLPLKLHAVLEAAQMRIEVAGGIPHDEFWRQVDVEYDAAPDDHEVHRELMAMDDGRPTAADRG
jgi:hypothetical protein